VWQSGLDDLCFSHILHGVKSHQSIYCSSKDPDIEIRIPAPERTVSPFLKMR